MDDSKEFQVMLDKAMQSEPLAFKYFDRTKNVQDQLQEMFSQREMPRLSFDYESNPWGLFEGFGQFMETDYSGEYFGTSEQLWLAFVMQELHQKSWNGHDWITK